jgi:hypothetical protein
MSLTSARPLRSSPSRRSTCARQALRGRGGTGQRVHLVPIKAFLANGQLYRTADGKGPAAGETPTTPGVPLVAPNQANLDWLDWHWEAEYAPAAGEPWESYTVPIYGAPGDTISIAQASMQAEFVEGLTAAKNVLAEEVDPRHPLRPAARL